MKARSGLQTTGIVLLVLGPVVGGAVSAAGLWIAYGSAGADPAQKATTLARGIAITIRGPLVAVAVMVIGALLLLPGFLRSRRAG